MPFPLDPRCPFECNNGAHHRQRHQRVWRRLNTAAERRAGLKRYNCWCAAPGLAAGQHSSENFTV